MGAQTYALSKLFKIGSIQVDILRREYWFKNLGLPYILILTKKNGVTSVKGFKFLTQKKSA